VSKNEQKYHGKKNICFSYDVIEETKKITKKLGSVNSNCLQKIEEAIKITLAFGGYTF